MGMSFNCISFVEQNLPSLQEQMFHKVYRYHSLVKIFPCVQSEFPMLYFAVVCFLLHCLAPPRTVWFQAVASTCLLPTYIAVRLPSAASLLPSQTLEQRQFWQPFNLFKFLYITSDLETQNSRKPAAHRAKGHIRTLDTLPWNPNPLLTLAEMRWHFGACGAWSFSCLPFQFLHPG